MKIEIRKIRQQVDNMMWVGVYVWGVKIDDGAEVFLSTQAQFLNYILNTVNLIVLAGTEFKKEV